MKSEDHDQIVAIRSKGRKRAVVFVHGLAGDPLFSWQRFPEFLEQDESLSSWDIFSFGYSSSVGRIPSFQTVASLLYTQLRKTALAEYDQFALVAHGEGGLIVQLALLDREDLPTAISHVFFFGVPTAGLRLLSLMPSRSLSWLFETFFFIPGVGSLLVGLLEFVFKPLFDLRPGSPFLRELEQRWEVRFGAAAPFQYWGIAGDQDSLVPVDSLLVFSAERRLVVPGNHTSLIKPESAGSPSVQVVRSALREQPIPENSRRAAEGTIALESKQEADEFDVFLYYASSDGREVRQIAEQLKLRGIRPWLTEDHVIPGRPWKEQLLKDFDKIKSVAVFIGKAGAPHWQKNEQANVIKEFADRHRPVIPVHLPGSPDNSELPDNLSDREPVDFRDLGSEPIERLIDGILGNAPAKREAPKLVSRASEPVSDKDHAMSDDDLLTKLGKIAGIGGIAVGTLLILFRKLVFPTLTANLTALFMFLCYGVAVLGLITWAAQSTKRRQVPVLLLIAAVTLAFFGWSSLHQEPGPVGSGYNVHVAVYSPDDSPIDHAQVVSSMGGETKEVRGGAEIALPSTTAKGQQLTVTAEVSKFGWKGSTDLKLDDDHSPTLKIFLKGGGELPVRGTVFNESGRTVPNALVSIIGFGEEAVPTGALGQFTLPSHAHKGEKVHLHAEQPPSFVADTHEYQVGSEPAELVLRVRGQDNEASLRGAQQKAQVHLTHDAVIDRVLINLATLNRGRRPLTEAQLADTLSPLFTRPAFYGIREENWRYFLYPLCRSRLLLEEYKNRFKSRPKTRENIQAAVIKMVQLQTEVAALYGPNFDSSEHIRLYIDDRNRFIDNMPSLAVNPTPEFFDQRDKEINEIRELLHTAGIISP